MFFYRLVSLTAILLYLLMSCSRSIDIPLPEEPAKPVLNAFLSQDSLVWASASLSGRFDHSSGNQAEAFSGEAAVKLYENDDYLETLRDTVIYNKRYFVSTRKVSAGRKYRLTLAIEGYEIAEGTDIVPDRRALEIRDQRMFLTPNKYGFFDFNFHFMVRNQGAESRYYKFNMRAITHRFYTKQNGDTAYYRNESLVELKAAGQTAPVFSEDYIDPRLGGVYALQPLSPGGQQFYALQVKDYAAYGPVGNTPRDSFLLEVSVLTPDAYNYLYTYSNVSKNEGDPTAEKQNVTGNVRNGFGIVGGVAVQRVVFKK
jgi:hypothetical protein